jgi:hypothetical protein
MSVASIIRWFLSPLQHFAQRGVPYPLFMVGSLMLGISFVGVGIVILGMVAITETAPPSDVVITLLGFQF